MMTRVEIRVTRLETNRRQARRLDWEAQHWDCSRSSASTADGGNTLKGNAAIDNDEWGFFVDAVLANMFGGNACSGNGLGGSNQPGIC